MTCVSTIPAPPPRKRCKCCGRTFHDLIDWDAIDHVGVQDFGDGDRFELRNCACGSTLAVPLAADGSRCL